MTDTKPDPKIDAKLTFQTLALRRAMPSGEFELAPIVAPAIAAYGAEGQTALELQLALSELPQEARPTTVSRYLLPDGVRKLFRLPIVGKFAAEHAGVRL